MTTTITRRPGTDCQTLQQKKEAALLSAFRKLSFKNQIQLLKAAINNLGVAK